jgi:hypothetical protein
MLTFDDEESARRFQSRRTGVKLGYQMALLPSCVRNRFNKPNKHQAPPELMTKAQVSRPRNPDKHGCPARLRWLWAPGGEYSRGESLQELPPRELRW